jgi:hypothetical protein
MSVPPQGHDNGKPLPELVVVPARPGADGPEIETRYTPNHLEVVLPVFSSVANLVAALGREQPWVLVPLARARETAVASGLARVVIDPEEMS